MPGYVVIYKLAAPFLLAAQSVRTALQAQSTAARSVKFPGGR